jgi:regulator of nucleoside diphosphate kinase
MENYAALVEPPLLLGDRNQPALRKIAEAAMDRAPEIAHLLLEELDRAEIVSEADLPDDVVTIDSFVTYQTQLTGAINTIQLVYPSQADLSARRISIVSGIGAALIGLRTGQRIAWELGNRRQVLTLLRVSKDRGQM